ncbi:hypothetical protein BT93_B0117 [Corymbia citriodora subsp. variegata]|nr:hypothetical protein BT93_B0117 [Corymbia citriodora subsp. variegata]
MKSNGASPSIALPLLALYSYSFSLAASDPRITEAGLYCDNSIEVNGSIIPNYVAVLREISKSITDQRWGHYSLTSLPPAVYFLAQCHGDLNDTDCHLCYAKSGSWLHTVDTTHDVLKCSFNSTVPAERAAEFLDRVDRVLRNVSASTVLKKVLWWLGRTVPEESPIGARSMPAVAECLENATSKARSCAPGEEAWAMNAGCFLRYSTTNFYSIPVSRARSSQPDAIFYHFTRSSRVHITIAIASLVTATTLLVLISAYIGYQKYKKRRAGARGGGSVYKGILPDGKFVTMKRLVFNTHQWVDDFFNEVTLINGIQHKNLVRLLGCSIEGPKSLLIYEYIRNKFLINFFLVINNATRVLTWEERLHIIIGTAEGLAYLHEVPEYLVRGQPTEKANVYAFRVLVLEILSGRKNSIYTLGSSLVLQSVWKHYKSNDLAVCIDPALRGEFPVLAASNAIQISLLCTQASVELRPSMSGVVEMLQDKDHVVPQPKQPFLNASVLNDKSSSRSSPCTHAQLTASVPNSPYMIEASERR